MLLPQERDLMLRRVLPVSENLVSGRADYLNA
jgi:hypothetical protein